MLSIWTRLKISVVCYMDNSFPHNPTFQRPRNKALWEKKKIAIVIVNFLKIRLFESSSINPLTILTILRNNHFENIGGKKEFSGKQHFRLFQQCFPNQSKKKSLFNNVKFVLCISMGGCNTILSAYTLYRHLG